MSKIDAWLGKNHSQRIVRLLLLVSVMIEIDLAFCLWIFHVPIDWTIYIYVAQHFLGLLIIVSLVINAMLSRQESKLQETERRRKEQSEVAKAEKYLSGEMAAWK